MRRLMLIALSFLAALATAAPALAGEHWDKYQNHNETFLHDETD